MAKQYNLRGEAIVNGVSSLAGEGYQRDGMERRWREWNGGERKEKKENAEAIPT